MEFKKEHIPKNTTNHKRAALKRWENLDEEKRKKIGNKISQSKTGFKFSEESKLKMKKSHLGKKLPQSQKDKISQKSKKMWEERREEILKTFSSGKDSPSWLGGKSFETYTIDWTKTLRKSIRERDKYICQICGESQGDRAHCVHHIDYDKKNCNPSNLITLCLNCHLKTNYNREYWINYFNIYKC